MANVVPGLNLFTEAVEKVLRNYNLRFFRYYSHYNRIMVLDEKDAKIHKCSLFFFPYKSKVTRIIADINCETHCVAVYRREDIDFVKRLAEDISSAAGIVMTYDLQELSQDAVAYHGCDVDCSSILPRKSLS